MIIEKNYNNIIVQFDQEQDIFINATNIARHFNKQASKWLENKDTIEYIEVYSRKLNIAYGDFIVVRKGGNDKTAQGTWIHQKLIVAFARWLSPEFAVWCDITIEEILKSQMSKPIQQPQTQTSQNHDFPKLTSELNDYEIYSNKLLGFLENLRNRNQIDLFRFDKIMNEQFGKSPLDTFKINLDSQYFLPTELGRMINKSAVEINLILEYKGFQIRENGVWKMTSSGNEFGILIIGKYHQIKWKMKTVL